MFVINRYTIFPCIALFYCVRKDFGDISDYERELHNLHIAFFE